MIPYVRLYLPVLMVGGFLVGMAGCASYEPEPMDRTGPPVGTMDENVRQDEQPDTDRQQAPPQTTDSPGQTLNDLQNRQYITVERRDGLVLITLKSRILFDLGSARINREAWPILDEVAKYLATEDENWILVAGHTDALPTRTRQFPSNWDLSAKRSVNVIKYMSNLEALDPTSLIAAGMAEHHPIASNQTEQGRNQNRRVEIFVIKDDFPGKEYRKQ